MQTIEEYQQYIQELERDLFAARQALLTEGLILDGARKANYFIRQKITCALTAHPNAVKYLLEEALGGNPEDRKDGA